MKVYALEDEFSIKDMPKWGSVIPKYAKVFGPLAIGYSPSLTRMLKKVKADVGHLHSIWDYTSHLMLKWAKRNNAPFLFTPHGTLNEKALSISKFKKSISLKLYAQEVLANVDCMQVNTIEEYEHVRNFGYKKPICMIGNGVHLPVVNQEKVHFVPWKNDKSKGKKILLYIGRIHPTKGIHHLVDTWNKLVNDHPEHIKEWHLVIVGFGFYQKNSYEKMISEKINNLNLSDSITTLPPHFGEEMKACYNHCDAYILPSEHEGISMALLTAFAYRKPVLMTKECNLTDAFEKNAAIKIGFSVEEIMTGIIDLTKLSKDQRNEISENGFNFVCENFTWEKVTEQLIEIYDWLLNRGSLPSTIIKDKYTKN